MHLLSNSLQELQMAYYRFVIRKEVSFLIFAVFFPFIAAFLVWLVSKKKAVSANIMIIISVVELIATNFMLVSDMTGGVVQNLALSGVGGLGISFKYIGFKGVFGVLTAVAWFVTFLFSKEYMKNDTNVIRYDIFNLMTLGATIGIFYAADFFTLFFFFVFFSRKKFSMKIRREKRKKIKKMKIINQHINNMKKKNNKTRIEKC